MWRFDDYADVVVGFDRLPIKFVFWRGVSYVPMMVNDLNQWFTIEFSETGFTDGAPGDCEPMSDKGSIALFRIFSGHSVYSKGAKFLLTKKF
jgi:hypothetical protein